jgi:hypothetical protein
MPNIHEQNFNKNVIEVYTEEPGFTGYKGLEWNKLDNIEEILTQGVVVSGFDVNLSTTNSILSGIKSDTDSVDGKLFVTGDPFPAGVQGTIVFQADLNPQFDGVMIYQADTAGNGKVVFNNTFVTLPHTGYIKNVTFINASNSTIEVKQDNTFDFGVPIPANTTLTFNGITGLQQLSARRFDQAAQPPLTGYFRWEAWRKNSIPN